MAETTVQPNRRGQYLVLYNVVSGFLWFAVLARTVLLVVLVGHEHVYPELGEFTKWTQTLAMLEILHSATGLVRASLFTTFLQVFSRVLIVWGVVDRYPRATAGSSPFYSSMLIAWSLAEIIRYTYLAQHLRGEVPGALLWLRYNAFYVLYPLGISSECVMVWRASKVSPSTERLVWYAALAAYIPGTYVLMGHMMRQRRRVIKGKAKAPPRRKERVSSVQ